MKNTKRIIATVLTAIMMISMLPSSVFAADLDVYDVVEPAVEAVSVPAEEQEIESTVEDVSVEDAEIVEGVSVEDAEAVQGSSEEFETVEAADPAAADEIEETTEAPVVDDKITLKAEGKDYVVTVTYDASALLPDGVQVIVEEIKDNVKKYDDYCDQALEAVQQENADVEELSYARLFDISLVDAFGEKVEPSSAVDVQIRLKDVETVEENTQIVHFAGEEEIPEVVETAIEGDTVSFETDGFSIYAVLATGDEGGEARLEVTLVLNNSEEDIVILVKPDDITDGEFEKIVYDPGIPEAEGKKFMGWTTEQNYTDATTPMTFDEVREDIQDKLASVKEGDTATYYAMMFNAFELYYVNENNVLFNTVSLMSTAESVTADVTQEYSVTGSTDGFVGWVEQGTVEPVYAVGQSITITTAKPQVVLTPKLGPGKWLYFDGNDGGSTAADTASYTPPAFIPQDTLATDYEPADPTRLGYTFDGWYTEAEGGEEFDFSQTLTEDKTVYAHWIPNPEAQYTVIVWAQSVDDNWDAADANKTYDYVESQKFTVATGTQITEDLLRQDGFLSKTDSDFGVTDLEHGSKAFQYRTFEVKNGVGSGKDEVSAMGDTVVNVYYDRKIMTIEFVDAPGATSQTFYEPVDEVSGTTTYGFVDGQYVPLTVTADRYIEWYRSTKATSTTLVGELETVYYSPGIGQTSSYDTADINIASAQIGTQVDTGGDPAVYYRGYSGNPNTLSTSISASPYYRDSAKKTQVYPVVRLRNATYSYDGQPYTGQLYQQETRNVLVYTGLYGQSLSKYGYEWPESTNGWEHIAYIGSFNGSLFGHSGLGGKANRISTSPGSSTSNTTIIFYVQDSENESNYTQVATARYTIKSDLGFMITERFLGSEPSGYSWTTSSTMPTTWTSGTAVDSKGYTTEHRGSNTYLHIKYDRVKNDIVFMLGSDPVHTIEDIPYGKNLSEYEDDAPEAPEVGENEYFYGWFEDPEGVTEVNWNGNMPLANKVIYGITGPVQYHVFIEMNAGGDTVDFGGASQKTEFWLDYGETISGANLMRATRTNSDGDSYSIIGYYTENAEAGQFDNNKLWNFDARVTEQSLAVKYTGPDDPRRAEYGDDGWDNTVGVFKLYASWRDDSLINSGGIHIRYDDGTETFVDPYGYADMATVIVKSELNEANCPEGKYFAGWKLGEVVYLPGQTFSAAKDAAVKESDGYYITLTAEYDPIEEKTPTHIYFYMNDGKTTEPILKYENVDINVGYAICAPPTREGYTFLGWAKDNEYEDGGETLRTSTSKTTADFLEYKYNKYYIADTETEVTQVAADEVLPYEALYAIWDVFYIYHSATGEIEECKVPADGGTFNLTAEVTDGYLYGGYWDYDAEADDHKGTIGTASGLSAFKPESGKTYYLKEVSPNCLLPQIYVTYANRPGVTKVLTHMYLLTDVDDQHYEKFGVAVDNKDHEFSATVSQTLRITQGAGYKDNSVKDLFNVEIEGGGYLGFADASEYIGQSYKNQRIELVAYYETHDHVKVTGVKKRIVALGDLTFQDWSAPGIRTARTTVPSTLSDVVSTSSTTNGLMSKARLVINNVQEENAFTITKVDGGKKISQEVEPGNNTGKITYAGKTNYVFAGWYVDAAYEKAADFTAVNSDMTVYAKYVKASNIKLSFTKKASKSGNVTLKATLKITGEPNITDAAVVCGIQDNSYPVAFAGVKTTKSGKTTVDTYTGTVELEGLANNATFSAAISYKTPDGSVVNMGDKACKYSSGLVTVK